MIFTRLPACGLIGYLEAIHDRQRRRVRDALTRSLRSTATNYRVHV